MARPDETISHPAYEYGYRYGQAHRGQFYDLEAMAAEAAAVAASMHKDGAYDSEPLLAADHNIYRRFGPRPGAW